MNNRTYGKGLAVVLIIAIIVMTAVGIKLSRKDKEVIFTENIEIEKEKIVNNVNNEISTNSNGFIYVDIDGAVRSPGVYKLKDGDRVNDAIIMAGGLLDNAFTKNINKARKLDDGEKIYILTEKEAEEVKDIEKGSTSSNNLININTADLNDLVSLPGIGDVYGQRIIEYRKSKKFNSVDDIKNIEGIGDKTFEKIKELITVK